MQDDRPVAAPPVGDSEFGSVFLLEQRGPADLNAGAVDVRSDPDSGRRLKTGCSRDGQVPRACGADDGTGEGMFRVGFCGSGQSEDLVGGAPVCHLDCGDGGFTLGEGAGLVEEHGVHCAHGFECEPVLDQDTAAGGAFGGDGDHQRDRESECVRAGDDQHGDGADDALSARGRVLGVGDQAADACEGGVLPDCGDLDAQTGVGGYRAGDNLVAVAAADGA